MESSQKVESILLRRVADGDRKAYKMLYGQFSPFLKRYVLTFVQNSKEDAEEVLQDVFLKIWIKRELLRNVKCFQSYIFRMAKNELINRRIKQNRFKEIIELQDRSDFVTGSAHEKIIYDEYLEAAQAAIGRLSPQRRRIFEMRTQMDMPIDQIASELNISKSAVKKQLYEAVHFMKKQLKPAFGLALILVDFTLYFFFL